MHLLIIAAFVVLFLGETAPAPPLLEWLGPGYAAAVSLGMMAGVWLATQVLIAWVARRMDRGAPGSVVWADRIMLGSRVAALLVHAHNVFLLGWLRIVRGVTGNTILVDELAAIGPMLAALIGGYWTFYPIERRIRDAMLLRDMELGGPMRMMPSRFAYVLLTLRHQAAIVLVPVLIILAWNELVEMGEGRGWFPVWLPVQALQLAGAAMALTLMPLVLRRVWDTIDLEPGPLREDLIAMCRAHRIRIREVLLWRTHGTMINGAVMGLIGPIRYVMLTDALLESLSGDQVRAVMAHELGHIRRRHMPWLAAGALSSIVLASAAAEIGLRIAAPSVLASSFATAFVLAAGLGAGLMAFGFASRRFEWQADAFAVQHLSGWRGGRDERDVAVTPEAVGAMTGALSAVASLNHIPLRRFTWRHGSIASRQRRLRELLGRPAGRLRPDREAVWVKVSIALAIACVATLLAAPLLS